ncbi:hypothetical protein ACTWPT_20385 [Nonomuraea sp. 3N208]
MITLRRALMAVAAVAVLGACGTTETAAPEPAASGGTASATPSL